MHQNVHQHLKLCLICVQTNQILQNVLSQLSCPILLMFPGKHCSLITANYRYVYLQTLQLKSCRNRFFTRWGFLKWMECDNGSHFTAEIMCQFCNLWKRKKFSKTIVKKSWFISYLSRSKVRMVIAVRNKTWVSEWTLFSPTGWHCGTVVSTAASQCQGPWFDSWLWSLPLWSLHILPMFAWVSSGCSGFLPSPKDLLVRCIGYAKFSLSVTRTDAGVWWLGGFSQWIYYSVNVSLLVTLINKL